MATQDGAISATWSTAHGDLTDEQWVLIEDLVQPYWFPGSMGRPVEIDRRRLVDAIFYVAATGCQWRALPACYPKWSTVHRKHLEWSRNGTWERVVDRLRSMNRERLGHDPDPSASIVDARTVRGASTVTSATRGYDAGKKISGRKTFGIVDTLGMLLAVTVVTANVSDNTGGIAVFNLARAKSARLSKLWCDGGFKTTFRTHCRNHHVSAEVVDRIHRHEFRVLPHRWIVERTWSWVMNHRRIQIDYEREPKAHEGFVWAAQAHILLRQLATR